MNDLAQFQPAFNGVNTLLSVSTNIETEQITNGNLLKIERKPLLYLLLLLLLLRSLYLLSVLLRFLFRAIKAQ
jgi:hypothetical protein